MIPTIKTKKFILRPFRMSDAKSVARHANDKIISRNTSNIPYPYSLKDARQWLKKVAKEYNKKNSSDVVFSIEIDGEAVGAIGLHKIIHGHKAELGYWLGREYWGGGVTTEAVKKVTGYGLKKMRLRRIYASVFSFNKASIRVLEKNAYKLEGISKKESKVGNRFVDSHIFSKVR